MRRVVRNGHLVWSLSQTCKLIRLSPFSDRHDAAKRYLHRPIPLSTETHPVTLQPRRHGGGVGDSGGNVFTEIVAPTAAEYAGKPNSGPG